MLTANDVQELEAAFAKKVFGNRLPKAIAAADDIGVNPGYSSVGKHGKSPKYWWIKTGS